MSDRTMVVYLDGEQYTFRDEEIEEVLEIGRMADNPEQAWTFLEAHCRNMMEP